MLGASRWRAFREVDAAAARARRSRRPRRSCSCSRSPRSASCCCSADRATRRSRSRSTARRRSSSTSRPPRPSRSCRWSRSSRCCSSPAVQERRAVSGATRRRDDVRPPAAQARSAPGRRVTRRDVGVPRRPAAVLVARSLRCRRARPRVVPRARLERGDGDAVRAPARGDPQLAGVRVGGGRDRHGDRRHGRVSARSRPGAGGARALDIAA